MIQTVRNHFLDKKLIGTLFKEEELDKKENYHNQVARDEKGNKHWHGAFTGGFQAGYKNTCGSRDGWAPQTFISSRNNKATYEEQTIDKFMDEDDVGKQRIGVNLTIAAEFDSFAVTETTFLQAQLGSNLSLGYAPKELVYQQNKSIGHQILQNIRMANRSQRRTYEIDIPDDDIIPTAERVYVSNDDYVGLGYKAEGDRFTNAASEAEQYFISFMRNYTNQETEFDDEKRKKENRMNFNEGAAKEKEEFNFELEDETEDHGRNSVKKIKQNMISNKKMKINDLFTVEKHQLHIPDTKYQIDVPKDYDQYHKLKTLVKQGFDMNKLLMQKKIDPQKKRKELFQEEELIVKEENATTIRTEIDRKKFVRGGKDTNESSGVKELFPFDKDKQQRFEHFCWEREGKMVGGIPPSSKLDAEQQEEEKKEFEHLYTMFQVQSKHVSDRPEPVVKVEKPDDPRAAYFSKRTGRKWVPSGMVSMRLGVPSPYNEEEAAMINKMNKRHKEPNKIEPKERFTPGQVYKESEEQILDPKLMVSRRFDPSQLGLPLSFKSMSMERNQHQQQRQQNYEQSLNTPMSRELKKDIRQKELDEPLDLSEQRVKDQSLFDSVFGDD